MSNIQIVMGTGFAGLAAALEAHDKGPESLLSTVRRYNDFACGGIDGD